MTTPLRTPSFPALFAVLFIFGSHLQAQQPAGGAVLLERENKVEAQKPGAPWSPAQVGAALAVKDRVRTGELSRAVLRLTNSSVLRLDELTKIEITQPAKETEKAALDLSAGALYFFSREKPGELQISTPAANGALRGTQLIVRVTPLAKTLLTVLEGEVDLTNAQGNVTLHSGEQGEAEVGKAPRKTAVIDAVNLLQWALYYPAVLDPAELGLSPAEERAVAASLSAYRQGDLLGALEKYPANYHSGSAAGQLYHAGVLLAVGRVDDAQAAMAKAPATSGRRALEQMIAAVKFVDWTGSGEPQTASEWLARSYYLQSKSQLEPALKAAWRAVEAAPELGYAWVRVAEMEFSFGHTQEALKALDRGLQLGPRNAQGHSLRGFLLSANNNIKNARASFEEAIAIDGALGNAWLGRGLTYIRQGEEERGRQDIQTAATLEPNRSILHSYLGKAFSQVGDVKDARKDLARAKELDPNDPTPWLYSAIENKTENRYNAAVRDLEKSLTLNDNRRVYRSQFLLDQDRGVRSTNLAAIYLNDGMTDVSVREAAKAVNSDYSSAPAHLFLSNSFNALRDPRRVLLRYETGWFNELLLSNLLSPVGGGSLSQFVSQQEYSKLFEGDGLGISSVTDYFSNGELRNTSSQYGTFGNLSYALDSEYFYDSGLRPNSRIDRFEAYATFKLQLTPQDTIFFKTKYEDLETGDVFQVYDDKSVGRETVEEVVDPDTGKKRKIVGKNTSSRTFDFHERQEPGLLLLGYHHEWNPGIHTLLLLGRLANDQVLTSDQTNQNLVFRDIGALFPSSFPDEGPQRARSLTNRRYLDTLNKLREKGTVTGVSSLPFDSDYRADFEIYSAELNQIITAGPQTFVLGGRYQSGTFETQHIFNGLDPSLQNSGLFLDPPEDASFPVDFDRINIYAYDIWRVAPWLSLTAGVTWDKLRYPENYRTPPINDRQAKVDQISPKAGFILTPIPSLTLRGAFTEGISGASFDESVRLEPTQVAGFTQAYRTIISEDIIGSVAGSRYKTYGLSLEQKLKTGTYWGLQYNVLHQDLDRVIGAFDILTDPNILAILPSSLAENVIYREDILTGSVNQLVGDNWSLGARYQYTKARLRQQLKGISNALLADADNSRASGLHELSLFALYNHPSGFFARAEADWYSQENDKLTRGQLQPRTDPNPGDDFWQLNVYAGWRFYRNQCEISCGLLNVTDTDYRLEPLNYHADLPRSRTFAMRVKFTF